MRVGELAVGAPRPQIGYILPPSKHCQDYINLEGPKEFAAEHRPDGRNTWLTFAISPAAPQARRTRH
jgi:hypothetical protein